MSVVSSSAQHELADINGSTNLDDYVIDNAYQAAIGDDPFAGALTTDTEDVTVVSTAYDGVLETGFTDLYYHHIWIIEKHTDVGNLAANQVRTIELWNSHFVTKTFSGYVVTGDVTASGLASGTLNPLESTLYSVSIPLVGSPTINATITWTFTDAESPTFVATIVGTRVIVFALRHNWREAVVEQISYKTDVLNARSGKEQRIGLIREPRRRYEMSYLTLTPLERSYLESVLYAWQGRSFAVPLWSDVTPLRTVVATGDNSFDLDTRTRDFEVGSLMFITDGTNYDVLEIESLTADTIVTTTGLLHNYNEARITPARLATLESKIDLSRITSQIEDIRLAWALSPDQVSTNRRTSYTPTTYRGIELLNLTNDYSDAITVSQTLEEEILDSELGLTQKYTTGSQSPRRSYPFRELRTRDDFGEFMEWFYTRKGRLNPFWFVERTPTFFLQTNIDSGDTTIVVTTGGYTRYLFPSEARKDIAIKTSAGWKYRRITGSVENLDGTETITIDSSLGVNVLASANPMMSLLKFVRLNQDTVELSYETSGVIQTATSFIDLLDN